MSLVICFVLIRVPRGNDYRQGHMLGCVAHSPRFRKSKTLCIVYFLLEAWSSSLRTRICFLLKTVSQSIKYTMYTPTCNLTWGHKTEESMRDNWALSKKCPQPRDTVLCAWLNFFKVMKRESILGESLVHSSLNQILTLPLHDVVVWFQPNMEIHQCQNVLHFLCFTHI